MSLTFEGKRLLVLYRKFYGVNYPAALENNQNAHVNVQKMYYLLELSKAHNGGYGFFWNTFGPYSESLQKLVRDLDNNALDVCSFYTENSDDNNTDKLFFSDNPESESLFFQKELDKVITARDFFRINIFSTDATLDENNDTCLRRWTELLGSLAYISQSMLPGAGKGKLVDCLVGLKPKYKDSYDEINRAFETLRKAKLLTCIES